MSRSAKVALGVYLGCASFPLLLALWLPWPLTAEAIRDLYANVQVRDLFENWNNPSPAWIAALFDYGPGSSKNAGCSPFWNLLLLPLVALFGQGAEVLRLGSMVAHVLSAVLLWKVFRAQGGPRFAAFGGAVVFTCPLYYNLVHSGSFISLSLALALAALVAAAQLLKTLRYRSSIMAGILLGANLHGYVVCRFYSVVALALLVPWLLSDRGKRADQSFSVRLILVALLLGFASWPFWIGGRPVLEFLAVVFRDQETVFGHVYAGVLAQGPPGTWGRQVVSNLFSPTWWLYTCGARTPAYTLGLLLAFALGSLSILRKREPLGILFLSSALGAWAALVFFTSGPTATRAAALALPTLVVAAHGLAVVPRFLSRRPRLLDRAALWACCLCSGSLGLWEVFAEVHDRHDRARIFEVVEVLIKDLPRIEHLVCYGRDAHEQKHCALVLFSLQRGGRTEEALALRIAVNPSVQDLLNLVEVRPRATLILVQHPAELPEGAQELLERREEVGSVFSVWRPREEVRSREPDRAVPRRFLWTDDRGGCPCRLGFEVSMRGGAALTASPTGAGRGTDLRRAGTCPRGPRFPFPARRALRRGGVFPREGPRERYRR